jgi:hypothetical protein
VLAVTNSQGDFTLTLPTTAPVTLTCGYADQPVLLSQLQRRNQYVITMEARTPTVAQRR